MRAAAFCLWTGLVATMVLGSGAIGRSGFDGQLGFAFQPRPPIHSLHSVVSRAAVYRARRHTALFGTTLMDHRAWSFAEAVLPTKAGQRVVALRMSGEGHSHGESHGHGHAHTHDNGEECSGHGHAHTHAHAHDIEKESSGNSEVTKSIIGEAVQTPAAAAHVHDESCSHGHAHEHSHENSHSHAHEHSHGVVEPNSHEHSHSHAHEKPTKTEPKSVQPVALAAPSQTLPPTDERMSPNKVLRAMVDTFMSDGGAVAAACFVLICVTKTVKIGVPFLYQFVLDSITAGAFVGPQFMQSLLSPIAAMGAGSGSTVAVVMALIALHTSSKITAQALQSLNDILFSKAVQPAVRRAGCSALGTLLSLPLAFHLQSSTGALTRSMERGMRAVSAVLSRLILHLLPQALELVLVAGIIAWKAGPELALVAVATVVAYAAFTIRTVDQRTKYIAQMNQADNQATNRMLDGLIHVETVSSYNKQDFEVSRYDESLQSYQKAQLSSQITLASLNWGQKAIESLGQGYLLLKTATLVMAGQMTIGELIMINALLVQMMGPLDHLGANYMQLQQGMEDGRDMFTIIAKKDQVDTAEGKDDLKVTAGAIEFENVHFGYDNVLGGKRSGEEAIEKDHAVHVLCGFNLKVEGGSTVAIVGESGCGKSTVTRLLCGSFKADQGKVSVDGQNVAAVTPDSLRGAVAVVQQEASLFNEDLWYNIMYGSKDGKKSEVLAAAGAAQLEAMVADLEEGYKTKVGERGLMLSGGQRQRVALARALLKKAPILVCDEATSALDVNTEGKLMEALSRERAGKTTILIAHRLSTVTNADKILVMEAGKVVEQGSHSALLADPGSRYAAMWRKQLEDDGVPSKEPEVSYVPVILEMDQDIADSDGHGPGCGCH